MKEDLYVEPRVFESLRSRVVAVPKRSNGKAIKIEKSLRADIISAFERSGMKPEDFAARISVSPASIRNWSMVSSSRRRGEEFGESFQKVAVDVSPKKAKIWSAGLIVEGPSGLRISGMTAREIVELWRQLC